MTSNSVIGLQEGQFATPKLCKRGVKDLLIAFGISEKFAAPDADVDALCAEQATIQAKIDALECWDLSRRVEQTIALRCPPKDSEGWHDVH